MGRGFAVHESMLHPLYVSSAHSYFKVLRPPMMFMYPYHWQHEPLSSVEPWTGETQCRMEQHQFDSLTSATQEERVKIVGPIEVGSVVSVTLYDKRAYTGTLYAYANSFVSCIKYGGNSTDVFKLQDVKMTNDPSGRTTVVYEDAELVEFNMFDVDSIAQVNSSGILEPLDVVVEQEEAYAPEVHEASIMSEWPPAMVPHIVCWMRFKKDLRKSRSQALKEKIV